MSTQLSELAAALKLDPAGLLRSISLRLSSMNPDSLSLFMNVSCLVQLTVRLMLTRLV